MQCLLPAGPQASCFLKMANQESQKLKDCVLQDAGERVTISLDPLLYQSFLLFIKIH